MLELSGNGDDSYVVWVCEGDALGPAKEFDMVLLLDSGRVVDIIHPEVRDVGDHTCR